MKPVKKHRVLDIAEKLFNRFGIRRTGVDEIARMANVAKGTIYNYFGSKDGLFKELAQRKFSEFEERLDHSIETIKDPIEKIKLVVVTHLNTILETPYLSDKLLYSSYEEKIKVLLNDLEQRTKSTISKIVESEYGKKIMPVDRKAIVNTIIFTLKGIDESIRNRMDSVNIKTIERDIDFLVKALISRVKTMETSINSI